MNTFDARVLKWIQTHLVDTGRQALALRSRYFKRAIVLGAPEQPNSMLVSWVESDQPYYLCHHFAARDPRSLAHGIDVTFEEATEYRCANLTELYGLINETF